MKSNNILFLAFFISGIYLHLQARIGCRDNSWHLQKKYDYKEDHAVSCLCPCPAKMGRCFQCFHYHEAQPFVIIKNNRTKNDTTTSLFNYNVQSICKKLIKKYYQKSSNTLKQHNNY